MRTTLLTTAALLLTSATVFGQVGINTIIPNTTMDVSAKRDAGGAITDNTQTLGLQAPRVTLAELTANTATYGINQQGALIYITNVSGGTATGQRINIDAVGYYSFDGSVWQKVLYKNIYNADGTLTSNRILSTSDKSLTFNVNSLQRTFWSPTNGSLNQMGLATSPTKSAGINLIALDNNSNSIASGMHFQIYPEQPGQIIVDNDATGLSIGTNATTNSAPITFTTSTGSNASGTEKMRITGDGNIGINTSAPTEKLDNNGITRLRNLPLNGATNAIYTTSGGTASATQNQTFTATKTLVADANGVLGYVTGLPGIVDPNTQNLMYARKTVSPIDANTPVNSEVTIGNMTLRFNGTNSNAANIEYKLSQANHVTILYHKGGSGGANLEEWGRQASAAGTWYSFNGESGNATRDINPGNRDIAYAIITLHNTKEVYRVTANANGDIGVSGTVPAVSSSITLFVERLQ